MRGDPALDALVRGHRPADARYHEHPPPRHVPLPVRRSGPRSSPARAPTRARSSRTATASTCTSSNTRTGCGRAPGTTSGAGRAEGSEGDIYIKWRVEGTEGLLGDDRLAVLPDADAVHDHVHDRAAAGLRVPAASGPRCGSRMRSRARWVRSSTRSTAVRTSSPGRGTWHDGADRGGLSLARREAPRAHRRDHGIRRETRGETRTRDDQLDLARNRGRRRRGDQAGQGDRLRHLRHLPGRARPGRLRARGHQALVRRGRTADPLAARASRSAWSTSTPRCSASRSTASSRTSTRARSSARATCCSWSASTTGTARSSRGRRSGTWPSTWCAQSGEYAATKGLEVVLELEPFNEALLKDVHELVRFVKEVDNPASSRTPTSPTSIWPTRRSTRSRS